MPGRTPILLVSVLCAAGVLAGCGSGSHEQASSRPPTSTPAPHRTAEPARAPTPAPTSASPRRGAGRPAPTFPASLPRSVPTSVRIPAIGVAASTIRLGLNADGTVQTPPSSPRQITGWFERSPTPGELGAPSVVLGHIDSHRYGPEVFWRLHELHAGDVIEVGRQDGTTARFAVDRVEQYAKARFPKVTVYGGGSALDHPGLRLITCGGAFDAAAGSYLDNIVVFASLAG